MGRALSGLLLLIGATAAHAEVQLQVDARPARAVLAILERGRLDEAGRVEDIVAKLVSLGQAVTLDDYHRSLAAVAAGEPSPADPLRFAQVGAHREAIERTVQAAVSAPKGLARRVAALIEPYSPGETGVALTLVLVAGSNSCGWTTDSPDHLFIDLRCIRDDLAGLELLAAH